MWQSKYRSTVERRLGRTRRALVVVVTGRKRKAGRRHPNGELVRDRLDPRAVVLAQPHRRRLPAMLRLDQKAEAPLGGLNLVGVITDAQYVAGRRYAEIVARYRIVIQSPRSSPRSRSDMTITGHGEGVTIDAAEARQCKRAYDRAFAAVLEAGQRAARAVARVAIYEQACPRGGIADLRRGLAALAAHFGLTGRARAQRRAAGTASGTSGALPGTAAGPGHGPDR
jgi:hypothetical protein